MEVKEASLLLIPEDISIEEELCKEMNCIDKFLCYSKAYKIK